MKILSGVVAHQQRKDMALELAEKIGAAFVSIDEEPFIGCNANHIRVWEHLAEHDSDWTLVVEDDAIPITDFPTHAHTALTYAPSDIVSFYLGRTRPPQWQKRIHTAITKADHTAWITAAILLHAVAVAVKTEHVPNMLRRVRKLTKDMPIDQAIGYWARVEQIGPIAYTWPSLVDHADAGTVITSRKDGSRRIPGRTAWKIGTPVCWDTQPVQLYDPTNPLAGGD